MNTKTLNPVYHPLADRCYFYGLVSRCSRILPVGAILMLGKYDHQLSEQRVRWTVNSIQVWRLKDTGCEGTDPE
jgi:hypothetical protein